MKVLTPDVDLSLEKSQRFLSQFLGKVAFSVGVVFWMSLSMVIILLSLPMVGTVLLILLVESYWNQRVEKNEI
jgi:hypothetical protein